MLTAKETISEVNLLRAGAETQASGLQDFTLEAQGHCADYPNSQGCENPGPIITDFQNRWKAWLAAQASNIQPIQAVTNRDPVPQGGGTIPPANPPGGPVAASYTFTNLTRGSGYQVGDSWRLDIYGPPNSPVSISATQNGNSLGTTPMGNTDASGHLALNSTFAPNTVGSWRELITVGSSPAPVLAFTVAAASAQPSGSGSGAGAGAGSGGSGSGSGSGSAGSPAPAGGFDLSSFLSSTFSVGGFNIPVVGALAGVGLLLFLAPRGR
jgi:hypothetical protein